MITFFFYLFLFGVFLFAIIPVTAILIGIKNGLQNKNGNGFSDYVNSNRISDRR